jgi:hypothetical protein
VIRSLALKSNANNQNHSKAAFFEDKRFKKEVFTLKRQFYRDYAVRADWLLPILEE